MNELQSLLDYLRAEAPTDDAEKTFTVIGKTYHVGYMMAAKTKLALQYAIAMGVLN